MSEEDRRRRQRDEAAFQQQMGGAVAMNAAFNTTAQQAHSRRMNAMALTAQSQGLAAINAQIGLAVVEVEKRNRQIVELGQKLDDKSCERNALASSHYAAGETLKAACREISSLTGEPLASVQKKFNAIRTRIFMQEVQENLARNLLTAKSVQDLQDQPWLDPEELQKIQTEMAAG